MTEGVATDAVYHNTLNTIKMNAFVMIIEFIKTLVNNK